MPTEVSNTSTKALIELHQQAHYWKAQHTRIVKREALWKAASHKLQKTVRCQSITIKKLSTRVEELESQIKWLRQQVFGRKTEQNKNFTSDSFRNGHKNVDPPETKRKRGKQAGAKGFGRKRYTNLSTEIIFQDLPEDKRRCDKCNAPFISFPGTEDSEEIHFEFRVLRRVYKRLRYSKGCNCSGTTGIITSPPPPKLIPKGLFSIDFWIHILGEKYLFQRPLSRTLQTLKMEGLCVSQGTITGGLQKMGTLLQPLYAKILERSRKAEHWHIDETSWRVFVTIDGKNGYKWWLWVVVTNDTCAYILDPYRSANVPKNHLGENAEGIISADRYSAYKALGENIRIAFCWAHVRRDFIRIRDGRKRLSAWAESWIKHIGELYHLNNERLKVITNANEFRVADEALRSAIISMQRTYEEELKNEKLHSIKRKTLESLRKHWTGLMLFVDNPNIPMDNNLSERQLRNPVVGRKNYYGSSVWSGTLAATAFTIFQTFLLNDINPKKFLKDYFEVCAQNQGKPPDNIDDFLPWNISDELKAKWRYQDPPP